MDAIETETVEHGGQTYRIRIYPDADAPNPLEDWSEMGTILSLNRRHANFDPAGVEEAIEQQPRRRAAQLLRARAVPLVGRRRAARRLPLPVGFGRLRRRLAARRRHAGIRPQLRRPDPPAFHAEAGPPGVRHLYASGATARSTATRSSSVTACEPLRQRAGDPLDSCWGFFGLDDCLSEARASIGHSSPGMIFERQPSTQGETYDRL